MKAALTQILGEEAADNFGEVPENITRMYRALNYLDTQLSFFKQLETPEDIAEHEEKVRASAIELLTEKREKK